MTDERRHTDEIEDRFQTLADETRIRILNVLANAAGSGETPISYSTLQSRVGIRDNGRLNYHLSELAPEFIAQSDAGYALSPAGWFAHLVAISQGSRAEPVQIDVRADCHYCGENLTAVYGRNQSFVVCCPSCDRVHLRLDVPFVRSDIADPSDFLDSMTDTAQERFSSLSRGLCSWCRSPVDTRAETTATRDEDENLPRPHLDFQFHHRCTSCAAEVHTTPGELLLSRPEIRAAHRRNGTPLTERYVWEVDFAVTNRFVEVRWEIVLDMPVGGMDIECVFDSRGNVASLTKHSHFSGV
jgi:hypothetical protein